MARDNPNLREQAVIRVAVFSDYFLPGFKAGGPPQSISRLLKRESHNRVIVVTRDRDPGDIEPFSLAAPRQFVDNPAGLIAYLRPGIRDWGWIVAELRDWRPELVYFNSLQSPWFTLLPLLLMKLRVLPSAPLLIAPRGESARGARRIKARKKRLARPMIRWLLGPQVTWHASSTLEIADIRDWRGATGWQDRVVVQPPPPPTPALRASPGSGSNQVNLVFASRIDRMKGLAFAIDALKTVSVPCLFRVYGVIRDHSYWQECLQLSSELPPHVHFTYEGEYLPHQAQEILSFSDMLILPTMGENFGHAIAEALSIGCPVAIPRTTMWTELVESGGGYIIDGNKGLREAIESLAQMTLVERRGRREQVHSTFAHWYEAYPDNAGLFDERRRSRAPRLHDCD